MGQLAFTALCWIGQSALGAGAGADAGALAGVAAKAAEKAVATRAVRMIARMGFSKMK